MRLKNFLYLHIFILSFTSCIQEVQTEFPELEREVVVNGLLVADEYAKIHLSWSGGLRQEGVLDAIEDAVVLLQASEEATDTLSYMEGGLYIGNQTLQAGKEYFLSVQVNGKPTITASDKIPIPKTFSDPEIIRIAGLMPDLDAAFSAIRLTIEHDPNEENFFHIVSKAYIGNHWSDVFYYAPFDPIILNEGLPLPLFTNSEMGSSSYRLNLNFGTTNASMANGIWVTSYNFLLVELNTISANTYRYYQQAFLHEKGRNKDFQQLLPSVINVYSNIENGRGILAALSRYKSDTLVAPPIPVF